MTMRSSALIMAGDRKQAHNAVMLQRGKRAGVERMTVLTRTHIDQVPISSHALSVQKRLEFKLSTPATWMQMRSHLLVEASTRHPTARDRGPFFDLVFLAT